MKKTIIQNSLGTKNPQLSGQLAMATCNGCMASWDILGNMLPTGQLALQNVEYM